MVAELGSVMLCAQLNIENTPRLDHAKYLNGWMKALKNDPKIFQQAATQAQQAVQYLIKLTETNAKTVKVAA